VNLRAGNREAARRAGAWLRQVRAAPGTWTEWPGEETPVHHGLDSGAAGIGWVLEDLARAGLDPVANRRAARSAMRTAARHDGRQKGEPSWHWGSAGIAAFAAHLAGWSGRGPGGQRL